MFGPRAVAAPPRDFLPSQSHTSISPRKWTVNQSTRGRISRTKPKSFEIFSTRQSQDAGHTRAINSHSSTYSIIQCGVLPPVGTCRLVRTHIASATRSLIAVWWSGGGTRPTSPEWTVYPPPTPLFKSLTPFCAPTPHPVPSLPPVRKSGSGAAGG